MSSVAVSGFDSSPVFVALERALESLSDAQRAAEIHQIGGIYEIHLKNSRGQSAVWTVDLKTTGTVLKGSFRQADVVLDAADDTFLQIASGRISSLKAFETGKLTVRGNLALVNKLDSVLKLAKAGARK
ncbi:sterol-binding-like protein [Cubamyces lactineus]|nr:sterol-binding-like protein [Cubamyces lactineus]